MRDGGENRRTLMLLSAFHVSTPTLVYKHWLNAALHHLFYGQRNSCAFLLVYLESVAKAFVFDRFLAPDGGKEYFAMIYDNKGSLSDRQGWSLTRCDEGQAVIRQHREQSGLQLPRLSVRLEHQAADSIVKAYEFTFRSSVEHYYPQRPLPGHDFLSTDVFNSFGNLCLISHSKNSRLSNFMPEAKKEYYRNNTIDSVKQHLMMKAHPWDTVAISKHYDEMKEVLLGSLSSRSRKTSSYYEAEPLEDQSAQPSQAPPATPDKPEDQTNPPKPSGEPPATGA